MAEAGNINGCAKAATVLPKLPHTNNQSQSDFLFFFSRLLDILMTETHSLMPGMTLTDRYKPRMRKTCEIGH